MTDIEAVRLTVDESKMGVLGVVQSIERSQRDRKPAHNNREYACKVKNASLRKKVMHTSSVQGRCGSSECELSQLDIHLPFSMLF